MTHQVLPKNASSLDPKIWRAIAGAAVQIPSVNDMVYYFPQGHVEASHPKNLSPQLLSRPITLCTVSDVHYLADTNTDEVFAKIFLQPLNDFNSAVSSRAIHEVDDGEEISSFTKMITHNDFKHASRLYFPKNCATSVFPPLDTFDHSILMTDVHGSTWKFRHVCCTRKHRLTDGWESFVHGKKLVPGDYVVFVKNPRGKLFIGIRRGGSFAKKRRAVLARSCVGSEATRLCLGVRNRVDDEENSDAMAAELAGHGMAFEVDYYPKAGLLGFVLKVEVVHAAMSVTWLRGMKIKMAVETDEYSDGTNWFTGVVSSVNVLKDGPWRGCPWRMLQT